VCWVAAGVDFERLGHGTWLDHERGQPRYVRSGLVAITVNADLGLLTTSSWLFSYDIPSLAGRDVDPAPAPVWSSRQVASEMVECDAATWKWLNVFSSSSQECMLQVLRDEECTKGTMYWMAYEEHINKRRRSAHTLPMYWMASLEGGDGNCGCFISGSLSSCLATQAETEARLRKRHAEGGGAGATASVQRRGRVPAQIHELFLSDTVPRTGNLPTNTLALNTSDARLVVLGGDLGQYSMTAQARAAETATELTNWKSDSSLAIKVAAGVGRSLTLKLTVALDIGTLTESWSADVPQPRSSDSNVPATGASRLRVYGAGFGGRAGLSSALHLGSPAEFTEWVSDTQVCMDMDPPPHMYPPPHMTIAPDEWASDTQVQAYTAASARGTLRSVLTLGMASNTGSITVAVSVDAPEMSGTRGSSNTPSTGCVSVRVLGAHFGKAGYSGVLQTLGTTAEASRWSSSSSFSGLVSHGLTRHAPGHGQGGGAALVTMAETRGASISRMFSHDLPTLSRFGVMNGPSMYPPPHMHVS
jgi:hypothetical protein